jgi:hypothetical protein
MLKLSFIATDAKEAVVASGSFSGEWIDVPQMIAALKLLLHPRSPTVKLSFEVNLPVEDNIATALAGRPQGNSN